MTAVILFMGPAVFLAVMPGKPVSASEVIMTEMVMPNDTNPLGMLLGGRLVYWMDIAAAICAQQHAERVMVTASIEHIEFDLPIMKGEVVHLRAVPSAVFRRSMEIFVEVWKSSPFDAERRKSNEAFFTFVAPKSDAEDQLSLPALSELTPAQEALQIKAAKKRARRIAYQDAQGQP